MTVEEFENLLKGHDWYYGMSDDPDVYAKGMYKHDKLRDLANTKPEFKKLYDEYCDTKYAIFK